MGGEAFLSPVRPVELHHLRAAPDVRFRSHDLLLPICTRHHVARPGDTTDAAHAATQDDWATRWFGSPARLYATVALLYATWAEQQRS